jgi:hypothetical protein
MWPRIGLIHSFCAMNSFSMSFCSVPRSLAGLTPCFSATTTYSASKHRRRRVDRHRRRHLVERDVAEQPGHVVEGRHAHALAADLAERPRVLGVVAHERRHVEGGRQPGLPEARRNLKRALVSSGVPKPANMRIVHGLPRYIVAWGRG